jgi:hypothetical protein
MAVTASCERCGKAYRLDEKFAGKRARCRACGGIVHVPTMPSVEPVRGMPTPAPVTAPELVSVTHPLTPDYAIERSDAYVRWPGEVHVDRYVPLVTFIAFALALVAPAGYVAYWVWQRPAGTPLRWDLVGYSLGVYLKMLAVFVPGLVGVPTLLLMLGVYVASRVAKFNLPDRFFLRCLTVVCAPVLIQMLVMAARMAQGYVEALAAFWWVVSMTLWVGVLWLMFRLRPAPFSATVGFAFIFCVGIPVALVLILALAVGIGVGAGRATLATAARSQVKVTPGFAFTTNPPATRAPVARPPLSAFRAARPAISPPPAATSASGTSQPSPVTAPPPVRPTRAAPEPRDPVADRARAEASLQKVGDALKKYAEDHGGAFPRHLDELSAAGLIDAADLRSPKGSAFVYSWSPRLSSPVPPQYVLVHELSPGADGKRAVLYGDGRIESVEASRWSEVMRESARARAEMMRRGR